MEPVLTLTALAAIPIAMGYGISRFAKYRTQKQRDAILTRVGSELGMVRAGDELIGKLRGANIGARILNDAGNEWSAYARFWPATDLGLAIWYSDTEPPHRHGSPFRLGDPELDRVLSFRAYDPQRAHQICWQLAPALKALVGRSVRLLVVDQGFALRLPDSYVTWGLESATRAIELANRVRDQVRPATPISGIAPHWQQFAAQNGYHFGTTPVRVWGDNEQGDFLAWLQRQGRDKYHTQLMVQFEKPLPGGFDIRPFATLDRVKELLSGEDHHLGDAVFDRTFLVRMANVALGERILDQHVRDMMLDLHHAVGTVKLDDRGLSVTLPKILQPNMFGPVAGKLRDTADAIIERANLDTRRGPYR